MCRIAKTNITDCHPWDLRTINLRFSFQRGKLLSGHRTEVITAPPLIGQPLLPSMVQITRPAAMRLSPGMEKAKEGENILIKNCSICIESRCCGWKKFLVSKLIFHYFIFNEFIELFDEINWKTLWPFYEKFWAKYSLFGKDLLAGGPYGRKAIQEKDVPFIEKLPLSLKNIVANTSMKGGQKACMDQMMEVLIVCHFILF